MESLAAFLGMALIPRLLDWNVLPFSFSGVWMNFDYWSFVILSCCQPAIPILNTDIPTDSQFSLSYVL
jgi:hypothetical protein